MLDIVPQDYRRAVLNAVEGWAGTAHNILASVRGQFGLDSSYPEWQRSYRAVDRALQALRKAKKIKFSKGSWRVI